MAIEQTLILIKPDGIFRRLSGIVIDRLDAADLQMVAAKMIGVSEELAKAHYAEHVGKPFYPNLIKYIRVMLSRHPWQTVR